MAWVYGPGPSCNRAQTIPNQNKMTKITEEQIKLVLEKHLLWINDKPGGEKADLSGANLTNANLTGANLTIANLFEAALTGARGIVAPTTRQADIQPTNTMTKVTKEHAQTLLTNIEFLKALAEGGQIQAKLGDSWVDTETPNLANYGPEIFRVKPGQYWRIVPKNREKGRCYAFETLYFTRSSAEKELRAHKDSDDFRIVRLMEVED